jgi:hypothetical protein
MNHISVILLPTTLLLLTASRASHRIQVYYSTSHIQGFYMLTHRAAQVGNLLVMYRVHGRNISCAQTACQEPSCASQAVRNLLGASQAARNLLDAHRLPGTFLCYAGCQESSCATQAVRNLPRASQAARNLLVI